jgi:hypothetical protein
MILPTETKLCYRILGMAIFAIFMQMEEEKILQRS